MQFYSDIHMNSMRRWHACVFIIALANLVCYEIFGQWNALSFNLWRLSEEMSSEHYLSKHGACKINSDSKINATNESVLIMQYGDSNLTSTTSYEIYSAILNHQYSTIHGYDYLYVQASPSSPILGKAWVFQPNLNQYRTIHWGRLPILIDLIKKRSYDWILYLDTDAVINPKFWSVPLNWLHTCKVLLGEQNMSQSCAFFFSNYPWGTRLPCSGSMLVSTEKASKFVDEWWNHNTPFYNNHHEYDQHGLYEVLFNGGHSSCASVLNVIQFFEPTSWLLHLTGVSVSDSHSWKRDQLVNLMQSISTKFDEDNERDHILNHHVSKVYL